jgi:hypothetical protein
VTTRVTRGTTVLFTATFVDVNGVNATPTEASVRLSYLNRGNQNVETITMTQTGSSYTGIWVADDPDVGPVAYHIYTDGEEPVAIDGKFNIVANEANPQSDS